MSAQRCDHADAVPVESGGETVAALCPGCDRQLPAEWLTCPHEPIDVSALDEPPGHKMCQHCGVGYWQADTHV